MTKSQLDNLLREKGYTVPLAHDMLEFILLHEGGLVEHPSDPGGLTNWGISLRAYHWLGRAGILRLSREQAGRLYQRDYWAPLRASDMPPEIACAAFDSAVNQGPGTAARLLQRAAQVAQDGKIGPVTLKAIRDRREAVLREFMALRAQRYSEDRNFRVFGLGWMRRVTAVLEYCVQIRENSKE
jgi:lysozyme family protein